MTDTKPNYKKMMAIIEETFATRNDPGQIQVTPAQMKKLEQLHPSTLAEIANEDGPMIWVLMIPTTKKIMDDFLSRIISETELLEKTKPGDSFDCIYLCSATTLPEYRDKGETKKLCIKAVREIGNDHPIKYLFVWPFTQGGEKLAVSVAKASSLELFKLPTC